ncbi:MAG: tyrosine-type recombinase/integrase [Solirubrobacteraceae bacterium]
MARPIKGSVTEHKAKDGRTYRYLRFVALGKRQNVRLGAVSAEQAEIALRHTLADVERGAWQPNTVVAPVVVDVPTFHAFAEEWWTLNAGRLAKNTQADYKWRLQVHLLPYFGPMTLDRIDFAEIERYIAHKQAEDNPLSPRSVNMTLTLLGAILERARKRKLIPENPARDSDLRRTEPTPTRSYLDNAAQIRALLGAAGELDRNAPKDRRHVERRAMLAVLVFAGLRISELCALRWRDVDLAGGWLTVGEAKTDAGRRRVKIRGALRDELLALRGRHQDAKQDAYVFATRTGAPIGADNFRNRVLGCPAVIVDGKKKVGTGGGAVGRANANLEAQGLPPLPPKLTPHSLRRTFCSLLYALGETPPVVMVEMGHTDPALALRVYAQAMRRGEDQQAELRELVEGVMANGGKRGAFDAATVADAQAA